MSKITKCAKCRQTAVSSVVLPLYVTTLEHDGRSYDVAIPDFAVRKCGSCGAISLNDDATDRMVEALRTAAGLLSPKEIRDNRKQLQLTQDAMAASLGIAVSTLSRWETGAQLQQRCMDKMLRAFFALEPLRDFMSGRHDLAAAAEPAARPEKVGVLGAFANMVELPTSPPTDSDITEATPADRVNDMTPQSSQLWTGIKVDFGPKTVFGPDGLAA